MVSLSMGMPKNNVTFCVPLHASCQFASFSLSLNPIFLKTLEKQGFGDQRLWGMCSMIAL